MPDFVPAPAYSARLILTKPSCRGGREREREREREKKRERGRKKEGEREERERGGEEREIKRLTRLEILELSLTEREVTMYM